MPDLLATSPSNAEASPAAASADKETMACRGNRGVQHQVPLWLARVGRTSFSPISPYTARYPPDSQLTRSQCLGSVQQKQVTGRVYKLVDGNSCLAQHLEGQTEVNDEYSATLGVHTVDMTDLVF